MFSGTYRNCCLLNRYQQFCCVPLYRHGMAREPLVENRLNGKVATINADTHIMQFSSLPFRPGCAIHEFSGRKISHACTNRRAGSVCFSVNTHYSILKKIQSYCLILFCYLSAKFNGDCIDCSRKLRFPTLLQIPKIPVSILNMEAG